MRKAEITLLTILYFVVTTLAGALIEKEYGITVEIKRIIQIEEVVIDK